MSREAGAMGSGGGGPGPVKTPESVTAYCLLVFAGDRIYRGRVNGIGGGAWSSDNRVGTSPLSPAATRIPPAVRLLEQPSFVLIHSRSRDPCRPLYA